MTEQDFIKKYGDEPQEVTKNYATKSLGTNYSIKDAFIENVDNSYDARIQGKTLNCIFDYNQEEHTVQVIDDGTGIVDATNLFKLGGTDKENKKGKIGKYGIGVPGAVSAIATKCVYNKTEPVEVIFESEHKGKCFEKHILVLPNGNMCIGETSYKECDENLHSTKILFSNVTFESCTEIIEALEETFEEPLHKDLNICFNGRQLGKSANRTFVGDEQVKTIMVGKFKTDVKYRIIGGDSNSSQDRAFNEAGLRVYDKNTGRLLAKSNELWSWYAGKQAQQNICGLRAAIYIESSIEAYNKFGIKSTKNGVTYSKYYKTDPDFLELASELASIYNQASKTTPSTTEGIITIGGREYQTTTIKMEEPYIEVKNGSYLIKKRLTPKEIAELVDEIITLKKKCERLSKKNV